MKQLFVIILLLFLWHSLPAQDEGLKAIKSYYKKQSGENCVEIYKDGSLDPDQIVLIRHGEPDLIKKGWVNRKGAIAYARKYDSVGVIPFPIPPVCIDGIEVNKAFHSNLPRARHTASLIFGKQFQLIENPQFREFERKVMGFPNIKLPLKFWMGSTRVLWFLGLNDKKIESFKQAKNRAKENASYLSLQSESDGLVILVAHGLHNRYVAKFLKQQGWKIVNRNSNDYLSLIILARIKNE